MVHIRLVLTMIFWGGTFVAGRVLVQDLHPYSAATGRFLFASILLLVVVRVREGRLPHLSWRQLAAVILLGLSGIFSYNIFFFNGLQSVEAGRAAMIIAVNPVVTGVLSALIFREGFSLKKITGFLIALLGAVTVISRGRPDILLSDPPGIGELCIVGCVLSWSVYTIVGKALLSKIKPLVAVCYSCVAGTLMLISLSLFTGHLTELVSMRMSSMYAIGYLAVLGTALGFIWFYDGVKRLGAGNAVLYVNLVPVSGVILGILILGEKPDISLLIGGSLVIGGLLLVNTSQLSSRLKSGKHKITFPSTR